MVTDNAMTSKKPWWKDRTPIAWKWIFLFGLIAIVLIALADYAFAGEGPDQESDLNDVGQAVAGGAVGGAALTRTIGGALLGGAAAGLTQATEEAIENYQAGVRAPDDQGCDSCGNETGADGHAQAEHDKGGLDARQ